MTLQLYRGDSTRLVTAKSHTPHLPDWRALAARHPPRYEDPASRVPCSILPMFPGEQLNSNQTASSPHLSNAGKGGGIRHFDSDNRSSAPGIPPLRAGQTPRARRPLFQVRGLRDPLPQAPRLGDSGTDRQALFAGLVSPAKISTGRGKTSVVLFSAPISTSVCKYRSWMATGWVWMTAAACARRSEAMNSPSA